MTDNLALWNAVERTPTGHTKAITGKSYNGTSPKPHYLVWKATETFGPCGIGWGFQIIDERIEDGPAGERMSIARVRVWYEWGGKRGEVEHVGGTPFSGTRSSGKPFMDEDAPKKSVTDALVKALSLIGFAGDIFMGRYDDSKYVSELRQEEREVKNTAADKKAGDKVAAFFARDRLALTVPSAGDASDWPAWRKSLESACDAAPTLNDVNRLWNDNAVPLGNLAKADEAAHKALTDRFAKRRHFFAQAPAKDAA